MTNISFLQGNEKEIQEAFTLLSMGLNETALPWNDPQTIMLLKLGEVYKIDSLVAICLRQLSIEIEDNQWHLAIRKDLKKIALLQDPFLQPKISGLKLESLNFKDITKLFSSSDNCKGIKSLQLTDCEQLPEDPRKAIKDTLVTVDNVF